MRIHCDIITYTHQIINFPYMYIRKYILQLSPISRMVSKMEYETEAKPRSSNSILADVLSLHTHIKA